MIEIQATYAAWPLQLGWRWPWLSIWTGLRTSWWRVPLAACTLGSGMRTIACPRWSTWSSTRLLGSSMALMSPGSIQSVLLVSPSFHLFRWLKGLHPRPSWHASGTQQKKSYRHSGAIGERSGLSVKFSTSGSFPGHDSALNGASEVPCRIYVRRFVSSYRVEEQIALLP